MLYEDKFRNNRFYFNVVGQPYSNEFYRWIGRKAPQDDIPFYITNDGPTISGKTRVAYVMFINNFHTELIRRVWEAKKQEQIQRRKPILLQETISKLPF